ncbi:hypothetical protein [Okeania sp. KiyG1]|uniref:hypothetical protein n=1 Tax=Okeania sp. KiyG1 TaxID=2720165 RepID=UPI0019245F7F|nr:hypothetical protein [Okeania sp. KiyG1]GGA19568.1 hypothetical protein CYANOKiyG1_34230 [Okeania sp. KiyG1]
MKSIKTEEFVSLLIGILSAMPPEGTFCKIVKSLAETNAWQDFMEANYAADIWEQDKNKILEELKEKFGAEIDMEEVLKEWEKQSQ